MKIYSNHASMEYGACYSFIITVLLDIILNQPISGKDDFLLARIN